MNPAALKANLGDMPKGGTLIVDTRDFTTRALARVGWTSNPLEDGTLDELQRARGRPDPADAGRPGGHRAVAQGRRPQQEHVRARAAVLDVLAPDRGHVELRLDQVRDQARHRRGEHRRVQGRLQLRRDHRGVRRLVRGQARHGGARHVPQHQPATWRWPTAWSRPVSAADCRCSSARTRSPRPADILHELSKHKKLRCAHVPGRGRDRRHRRRAGRGVRWRAGRHHVLAARASPSRARRSAWRCRSSCR